MFFSAKQNAFYDPDLKFDYEAAKSWPIDAVQVEQSVFDEFGAGSPPQGKQRGSLDGLPCWVDIPEQTDEQKAAQERQWRDSELKNTDVYLISDFPISPENKTLILEYREALRDYPETLAFPNGTRPQRPVI